MSVLDDAFDWTFLTENSVTLIRPLDGPVNEYSDFAFGELYLEPTRAKLDAGVTNEVQSHAWKSGEQYEFIGDEPSFIARESAEPVVLVGTLGRDTLQGGSGDDVIFGSLGRDNVYGNDGNDRLFAFFGSRDNLYGGAGADVYVFKAPVSLDLPLSIVTDRYVYIGNLEPGEDKLDLSRVADNLHFIDDARFSGTPGEVRIDYFYGHLDIDIDGDRMSDMRIMLGNINDYNNDRLTADEFIF